MSDEFEVILMGKSPIEDAVEWLIIYERMCKEIARAFAVPAELLEGDNLVSDRSSLANKISCLDISSGRRTR